VVDTGLDVVFGAQIPRYVVDLFRPEVDRFLIQHDLTVAQIDQLVLHPGGTRVVEAYEKALGVPTDKLDGSWAALRNYGNMSSPTVFFVLDWIKRQANPQSGQYGLLGALGPGFSAEQVLIRF
jgi:alkylresorcinol/alkylpyrone synthase